MARTYNSPDDVYEGGYYGGACVPEPVSGTFDVLIGRTLGEYRAVLTPHYHQKLKEGAMLPYNPYFRKDYRFRASPGSATRDWPCSQHPEYVTHTDYWGFPTPSPWQGYDVPLIASHLWEDVDTDALLVAAIAGLLPEMQAFVTAAEMGQSLSLIRDAHTRASGLVQAARSGKYSTVQAMAEARLEWQYGWKQLHNDMQSIREFLEYPIRGVIRTNRVGTSRDWEEEEIADEYTTNSYHVTETWTGKVDASYRAIAACRFHSKTLNLNLSVVPSIWELITYSFVADWFFNIGNVLSAWTVLSSVEEIQTALSYKVVYEGTGEIVVTDGNTATATGYGTAFERAEVRSRRKAGVPSLVPSFTGRLSSSQITDLAALLVSRVIRGPSR